MSLLWPQSKDLILMGLSVKRHPCFVGAAFHENQNLFTHPKAMSTVNNLREEISVNLNTGPHQHLRLWSTCILIYCLLRATLTFDVIIFTNFISLTMLSVASTSSHTLTTHQYIK